MKSPLRILHLEDDPNDVELAQSMLEAEGITCDVVRVDTRTDFLAAVEQGGFNIIFADYSLPSFDGIAALAIAQEKCADVPLILISGRMGEEVAIESLKSGATDYVLKQRMSRLVPSVRRALREVEERSEREQADEALARQSEEPVRTNAELLQFVYVASHDLQEPLRMVVSYLQLLERRYKGKLDADADDFIAYAVDGAKRMKTLINDLLTYSRVSRRGKEFAPTSCEAVLIRVLTNLQLAIEQNGAKVTYDPLPTVIADEYQLEQLFENLIDNAIKFRSEAPPRVQVSAERNGNEWVFAVRDNGIGIEPKHAERIFDVFQRLHTRFEYVGTGIGLAICKKVVKRHGGRIWVKSRPKRGATFYFTIQDEPFKGFKPLKG